VNSVILGVRLGFQCWSRQKLKLDGIVFLAHVLISNSDADPCLITD
jgi:hypothetical protein